MTPGAVEQAVFGRQAIAVSHRVHWICALDPGIRTFDVILKTANGTRYNAYIVRGSDGIAVTDMSNPLDANDST